jgi:putative ABC transport system permease protein
VIRLALKMLVGDRARYLGIVMGLTFAALLITQQSAIFVGLMTRSFGAISDLGQPGIWVMDPKVQFIDDVKPLQDTQLLRVRGVDGVAWAVPLYKGLLKVRLADGAYQTCNVLGLDDSTLIGGPPEMVVGTIADLRRAEAVIVDEVGANGKLASLQADGTRRPVRVGDTLELNDHRAIVVGICRVSRTFQSQPVLYTTYQRATTYAPRERKLLSFVLAEAKPGVDAARLCDRIAEETGLLAARADDFKVRTYQYFLKYTGIPINFGIAVLLGFVIGTAIAGQTFYNFTLDNLRHFGTLKAMGARPRTLLAMILVQALVAGSVGWGLGVGGASFFGIVARNTELAFRMPWQLLALSGGAVLFICLASALLAIRTVLKLEPAIVFKG